MTKSNNLLVDIYRSKKKEGMYLYLKKGELLTSLPEELQQVFGKGELAMSLLLHAERTLANADVEKVMLNVREEGYYLQMPPKMELDGVIENNKMPLGH